MKSCLLPHTRPSQPQTGWFFIWPPFEFQNRNCCFCPDGLFTREVWLDFFSLKAISFSIFKRGLPYLSLEAVMTSLLKDWVKSEGGRGSHHADSFVSSSHGRHYYNNHSAPFTFLYWGHGNTWLKAIPTHRMLSLFTRLWTDKGPWIPLEYRPSSLGKSPACQRDTGGTGRRG